MSEKSKAGMINTRADLKDRKGANLTDKQMSVYFAYLINSYRNPNGQECHRYLYLKDISKKEIGEMAGVSQPTVRKAEQRLEEEGYICYSLDKKIMFFPDHEVYSWIPVHILVALLKISRESGYGGDLLRLYSALHYYRHEPQSFNARTWVRAFGLPENHQENYVRIHVMLFLLELYGLIEFDKVMRVARGGKQYLSYENVTVVEGYNIVDYDDSVAPVTSLVDEYSKIVARGNFE